MKVGTHIQSKSIVQLFTLDSKNRSAAAQWIEYKRKESKRLRYNIRVLSSCGRRRSGSLPLADGHRFITDGMTHRLRPARLVSGFRNEVTPAYWSV